MRPPCLVRIGQCERDPDPPRVESSHSPPSGTVTFVFTDTEGSTERWDREREAMQDAVRRHDMRAAIGHHGGYVFKTIASEDFSRVDGVRVRMAIHTGTADERDGDCYGRSLVPLVESVRSFGRGHIERFRSSD